ncbi:hypothetical protein ASC80_22435 [Afipia sp. Root123D2]|jgi:undecaprenyl-diphosphatase|nr:hypothetical protein ASC80_22435 [Afipia sp. Root123D2]OJV00350.1 MAG: hypothetical protein BGO16_15225 [Nitrobacter sp. 62-23]
MYVFRSAPTLLVAMAHHFCYATGDLSAPVILGVAALFLAFGLLAADVAEGDTTAFDNAILVFFRQSGDMANTIGPLWLKEAARDLTALGSTVVLGLVFVAVLGYLIMLRKRAAALLILGAVSAVN